MISDQNWIKYTDEKGEQLPSGLSIEILNPDESSKETKKLDVKNIITKYNNYYFIDKNIDDDCPQGIIQSSEWAELQVIGLIRPEQRKQWDEQSVKQILAWKTGKIKQKETQKEKKFIYAKGWQEHPLAVQLPNQRPMDTTVFLGLSKIVIDLHKDYCEKNKNEKDVWTKLLAYVNDNDIAGLGSVYLITLLFFITNGDCPIYDRFAMAALASFVLNEKKGIKVPDDSIFRGCGLPDRKSKYANELILDPNSKYKKYQQLLKYFFGDDWNRDIDKGRDIDRALWVYGHKFKVYDQM